MIALPALALLAAAPAPPALVSVHAVAVEGRAALEVVTTTAAVPVSLSRTALEAVLTLEARLPTDLGVVAPVPPLQAIEVKRTAEGVAVRVRVDAAVPHEVRRQGALLTVLFGRGPLSAAAAPGPSADVSNLYRGLLPAATPEGPTARLGDPEEALDPTLAGSEAEGLQIGLLTLRPFVSAVYVDAANALLDTATPLADRYYEVRPQVAAEMPLGTGRLRGDYEARLREGSRFALVEGSTTHLANVSFELPLGPNILSRAAGHLSRGVLETNEVDPGREYFFQLGRYERYDVSAGLRVQTGSRFDLDLSGSHYAVDVADGAGFFDYEGFSAGAGLGVELGPRVRAVLGYGYDEIPSATARAEARMQAHSGTISLQGEVLPLVTGYVTAGYRDQRNPGAGPGGTRYRGVSASARVLKEFSRSTTLQVTAARTTPPSAFESNGFFVATSILGELNLALPLSFVALAGGGYHHNAYRVVSAEIGVPREDRIATWMAGLGRSVTDWVVLRVDYRYEQRESNLDRFDTDGHAFTAQIGVRLYRPRVRR
jgi:hypothetical protein